MQLACGHPSTDWKHLSQEVKMPMDLPLKTTQKFLGPLPLLFLDGGTKKEASGVDWVDHGGREA